MHIHTRYTQNNKCIKSKRVFFQVSFCFQAWYKCEMYMEALTMVTAGWGPLPLRWPSRCEPGWEEAGAMKEEGRAECGGEALFEDPDFPSEDASLLCDGSTPIARLQEEVTWLRPQVRRSASSKREMPWCIPRVSGVNGLFIVDKMLGNFWLAVR